MKPKTKLLRSPLFTITISLLILGAFALVIRPMFKRSGNAPESSRSEPKDNFKGSGGKEMEPFTDVTPGKKLFFVVRNLDTSANGEESAMVYDETIGCMLYIRLMPKSDIKWVPVSFCDAQGNPTPKAVPVTYAEAKAMWYLHGGGLDSE